MKPYYDHAGITIYHGDCLDVLKGLPDVSIQCCITSPPYWGLRDYGIEGQLGLEPTLEEYVSKTVEIFREVKRILRNDGTLWLNLGDSYSGSGRGPSSMNPAQEMWNATVPNGLKPKDLCGIPWRVAFALQADGWYLRSDIIWAKPNPMPESVTDRPTKAHEYLFLLTKAAQYYYDAEAVKEPVTGGGHARKSYKTPVGWDTSIGEGSHGSFHKSGRAPGVNPKAVEPGQGIKQNTSFAEACCDLVESRNLRSVWTISSQPFLQAHFAVFPEALVEPCVKAGCPAGAVILDPFAGAGTTLKVAKDLECKAIGIELNEEYIKIIEGRIEQNVFDFGKEKKHE